MIKPIHYREMWDYFLGGNPLSGRLAVRKFDLLHARYFYFLVYFARLLGHDIFKFRHNKETFYQIGDKTMKSSTEKALQRKGLSRRGRPPKSAIDRPQPTKEKPIVLTPDQEYIEINAVIRVPIEIGQPIITQS